MAQNTSSAVMQQRAWQAIPGFPGYWANRKGEVLGKRGWVLSPNHVGGGYLSVHVRVDGRSLKVGVHVLVCTAFHGAKPDWADCAAHRDGVRNHNFPDNLRWATDKQNSADMVAHGTAPQGERHPRAGLTFAGAAEIRRLCAESMGATYVRRGFRQEMAARFDVSIHVVKDVIAERSWNYEEARP